MKGYDLWHDLYIKYNKVNLLMSFPIYSFPERRQG